MGFFSSRNQDSLGRDSRRKIAIYLLPDIETTYGTMSPAGLPAVAGSSHHSGVLLWAGVNKPQQINSDPITQECYCSTLFYHIGCYGDDGVYQQWQ